MNLEIGTKIKIGEKYAHKYGFIKDDVITLIDGYFEYDNGLYTDPQNCPSIWNKDQNEFDSIYHLFGNDLEHFMDCTIL